MNAVVKQEPVESLPAVNETAQILSMIERAASNPAVDLDKWDRLMAMRERVENRAAKMAFDAAFALMQPEIPVINEKGQIKVGTEVRSHYAKWEDIAEVIKPILARHGFSFKSKVSQPDGKVTVTSFLSHSGGHTEQTDIVLPIDSSGAKNPVQAVGSSISYGQRYGAKVLLSMTSRSGPDKDDDGKAAGDAPAISEEQVMQLRDMLETDTAVKDFCTFAKIEKLGDMFADKFDDAVRVIEQRARVLAAKAAKP